MKDVAVVAYRLTADLWLIECSLCGAVCVCVDIETDALSTSHLKTAHAAVAS